MSLMYRYIGGLMFLCFVLIGISANAQSLSYKQYSTEEGMPSSEVYHVTQDAKGFMWFATNYGVSRFDGYRFVNYTAKEGLPENTVFDLFEDFKGRMWFVTMSMKLGYFYEGKIYLYKYNDVIQKSFKITPKYVKSSLYVDSLDNVYLTRFEESFRINAKGETYFYAKSKKDKSEIYVIEGQKALPVRIMTWTSSDADIYLNKKIIKSKLPIEKLNKIYQKGYFNAPSLYHKGMIFSRNDDVLLYTKDLKNWGMSFIAENLITYLYVDSNNDLFVCSTKGIYIYSNCDLNSKPIRLFENEKITCIVEDKEKGYWFTTLENGAFYLSTLKINCFNTSNGLYNNNIICLEKNNKNSTVYLGYYSNAIGAINQGVVKNYILPLKNKYDSNITVKSLFNSKSALYIGSNSYVFLMKNNNISRVEVIRYKSIFKDGVRLDCSVTPCISEFCESTNNEMWLGGSLKLFKMNENNDYVYDSFFNDNKSIRVDGLYESVDGTLWIGSVNGLWRFYPQRQVDRFINYGEKNELLKNRILCIKKSPVSPFLFIATKEAGLLIFNPNTEKIIQVSTKNGITSDFVKDIFVDNNTLWLSTNNGISKLTISDYNSLKYTIENYNQSDGFPSNDVNQLLVFNKKIYVATNKGLAVVSEKDLSLNKVAPPVYITQVKINNKDTILNPYYILSYDQNMLNIDFVGLSFKDSKNIEYKYIMEGIDSEWKYTKNMSIQYTTLPAGKYKFKVFAKNNSGVWSKIPAIVSFEIRPPFWNTWWFITLVILLFIGSIWLYFNLRIKALKAKEALKQDIIKHRQKALQSQMNPHFIFNSLNSIQNFIVKNEKLESMNFLSKFSKLMRVTLQNSEHQVILLQEELVALKLYLDLEVLRFKNKFNYEVIVSDQINSSKVLIPPLIIQPFIENSIKHGFSNINDRVGLIKLELFIKDQRLVIVIEDNGVGRKKAIEQNSNHVSMGSNITEKRLKMLNLLENADTNVMYTDLYSEDDIAIGTRVEVSMPLIVSDKG